jgi:hypothetical protein
VPVAFALVGAVPAVCQSSTPAPGDEFKNDTDPTQLVFFGVRQEYFNLEDGAWVNMLILRSDRAFLKKRGWLGGKVGLLTRFDLPVTAAGFDQTTEAGLGDLYGQVLYLPFLTPRFALGTGSGLVFPTATHRSLGSGKWQLAPLGGPIWFFPHRKGYFLVKAQDFFSFSGDDKRPNIHFLLTTPTLLYRLTPRWWILVDTESKTNWERDNRTSFRSGVQVGRIFRRRFAVWIKPEVPWGGNREGDWALKVALVFYH